MTSWRRGLIFRPESRAGTALRGRHSLIRERRDGFSRDLPEPAVVRTSELTNAAIRAQPIATDLRGLEVMAVPAPRSPRLRDGRCEPDVIIVSRRLGGL
jgi:hypothetical protein